MSADDHFKHRLAIGTALLISLGSPGCAQISPAFQLPWSPRPTEEKICPAPVAPTSTASDQAQLFRKAETERAEYLGREIERLQADLKTAESALVEAESGLAGSHTRADAVSSLAVTRIQVERAFANAPWRADEIQLAREKLAAAELEVAEGRFGAAIFFVYRARRVADSVLAEAAEVMAAAHARLIRAERVNLRAGPSADERILSVLKSGTPVITQTKEGEWMLVQVKGGPTGWIHHRLIGDLVHENGSIPASPIP